MPSLFLRPADTCQFDLVSLGEIMLRLDPGETRIHTARQFRVWEGGGEYNVARGLRALFWPAHRRRHRVCGQRRGPVAGRISSSRAG